MNRAIGRVGTAVIVLVLVLVAQLTYLQIVDADNLENDPRNVRSALRDANRPRGKILTADGVVLAESVPSNDGTEFKFQRQYPEGALFSQVVGYQSFVFGNTGVEKTYNDVLVGRDAELQLENLPDLLEGSEAVGNVVLSLRADVQRAARDALGDQRGSVVAIEPSTGKILAMYSNPSFDPQPFAGHDTKTVTFYGKALADDPNKPDLPRAYREIYAPGSTFKVVTAGVGIENGTTNPGEVYPELRELPLPQTNGQTLNNFGGRLCGGTLANSLRNSCNTTFGQLGLDLGDSFVPGMERFGIEDAPPLDLAPGAVASIGPPAGSFANHMPDFAFAGIGQGQVATTPLQMALVAAGIANGGVIMAPHVGAEIRDGNDDTVRAIDGDQWKTAVSPTTAQAVNAMMVDVVANGTGTNGRIPGVTVAGKTGTAEAPNDQVHAWFISFAPAEAPSVAVAVIVEGGGSLGNEATGGQVAAPIARAVMQVALSAVPAG